VLPQSLLIATYQMNLQGKKAIVTGGGKRVGRAIAMQFAEAGCDVAIHYHASKPEALEVAATINSMGRRAFVVYGDLNCEDEWRRIIDVAATDLGGLDILVNNASVFSPDPDPDPDLDPDRTPTPNCCDGLDNSRWERTHRINALAPAALSHYARPYLEKGDGGVIVNLSDISAGKPWPGYLAYCSSKAALNSITTGCAKAFAPKIRVNAIAPGIAIFPDDYDSTLRKKLVDRVPLLREGTPPEVAKLVRFLCEDGDYITGQIIAIDGGRSLVS